MILSFLGCKSVSISFNDYKAGDWPYQIEGIYGSKIFVHNATKSGLLVDVKERKITKLFDSKKVNATRVQGSTLVWSDVSPNYKYVAFKFIGADYDLADKFKTEDQINIFNAKSKILRCILDKGGYDASSSWTKDGEKYIFSSSRLEDVYLYNAKKDQVEKIKKPEKKVEGNIIYIKDKYVICNLNKNIYQYSDNNWTKVMDNWEGEIYKNSQDDCYLIDNKKVYKLFPQTKQIQIVYSLPENSKPIIVRNSSDIFVFYSNNKLHVFNTTTNKETLFKINTALLDTVQGYISTNGDKILITSWDDHKSIISTENSSEIYDYGNKDNPYFNAAGWYDNDSIVIIDGEDVSESKIFDLKTKEFKNLLR